MEPQVDRKTPRPHVTRIQRAVMSFIAVVYLFVGLSHATAHVHEMTASLNKAISTTMSFGTGLATESPGEADSKRLSADGEYCQAYAPSLVSVPARVASPAAHIIQLSFFTPTVLAEDRPRLDTPPPKRLI